MKKLITLILILFINLSLWSQGPDTPIPVSDKVKIGTLDNGLTYYLRENAKPEDKIELRLVINAGSILEDEKQLGLAHFLEHMAFNGTTNFAKNDTFCNKSAQRHPTSQPIASFKGKMGPLLSPLKEK